jgi:hypothetical protein
MTRYTKTPISATELLAELSQNSQRRLGWVRVDRALAEHPIVGIGSGRLAQWVDLILMAAYEPRRISNKGVTQTLQPGQLMGARSYLAKRWHWGEQKVRVFLKRLRIESMIKIDQQKNNSCMVITICNYDKYQIVADDADQTKEPAKNQRVASEWPESNKLTRNKKSLSKKKDSSSGDDASAFFEAFNALAAEGGITRIGEFTRERRELLQYRLAEHGQSSWRQLIANIEASAFLRGRSERGRISFGVDWFLKKANYRKVIEGTYGNGATSEDHNSLDHYYEILKGDEDHDGH